MPRYRKRSRDEDDATPEDVFTDFVNVENRREEPFPEEFAEGPYGAPTRETDPGLTAGAVRPPGRQDNAPGPLN